MGPKTNTSLALFPDVQRSKGHPVAGPPPCDVPQPGGETPRERRSQTPPPRRARRRQACARPTPPSRRSPTVGVKLKERRAWLPGGAATGAGRLRNSIEEPHSPFPPRPPAPPPPCHEASATRRPRARRRCCAHRCGRQSSEKHPMSESLHLPFSLRPAHARRASSTDTSLTPSQQPHPPPLQHDVPPPSLCMPFCAPSSPAPGAPGSSTPASDTRRTV